MKAYNKGCLESEQLSGKKIKKFGGKTPQTVNKTGLTDINWKQEVKREHQCLFG